MLAVTCGCCLVGFIVISGNPCTVCKKCRTVLLMHVITSCRCWKYMRAIVRKDMAAEDTDLSRIYVGYRRTFSACRYWQSSPGRP